MVDVHVNVLLAPLLTVVGEADSVTVGTAGALVTATDAVDCAVPPAPLQLSVNVVLALKAPVLAVPDTGFVPLHPPEAVQEFALVDVHVNVLALPLLIVVGDADSATLGAGGGLATETDAVDCAVPPAPVQLSVNVVLALKPPVLAVPDTDFVPLQPPDAVQAVAFVELHVNVLELPLLTVVGDADNATVGAGVVLVTATDAVDCAAPPAPVQRRVKLVFALNAPVLAVPDTGFVPLHPPEAVQEVALVDVHDNVLVAPLLTAVGDADNVTVGVGGGGVVPSTVTDALASAVPPAPVQRSVKTALAVIPPVLSRPETDLEPLQPPDAVHEVALVDDQLNVLALLLAMVVGDADNVTVGAGVVPEPVTVTVVLACVVPREFEQLIVKVALAFNAPVV